MLLSLISTLFCTGNVAIIVLAERSVKMESVERTHLVQSSAQDQEDLKEPSYNHLVYGGVWKHAVLCSEENSDVASAKKAVIGFIKERLKPPVPLSAEEIKCITRLDLWYTVSNQEPFLVEAITGRSHKNPVSVPFSFGCTYNFNFDTSASGEKKEHFMTVTKMMSEERHFVYSHTYRDLDFSAMDNLGQSNADNRESGMMCPLSMLAVNKQLKSCLQGIDKEAAIDDSKFSIMTYNIWNYFTYSDHALAYSDRISRLVQLVKAIMPDVIGFQEVRLQTGKGGHLGPSQMDHILPHLPGYQFVFQPAMMQGDCLEKGRNEEGVGIFSKYPIVHHDYILLYRNTSNSEDGHQRICLHAIIDVPGMGLVHVFNTHWSLHHEARERAATQILDFMKQHSGPAILLGDMNAVPEEKSIRILQKDLCDTWTHLHQKEDGPTFSTLKEKLTERIDYIFYRQSDNLQVNSVKVVQDKLKSEAASDHCPMLANFSFSPKEPS